MTRRRFKKRTKLPRKNLIPLLLLAVLAVTSSHGVASSKRSIPAAGQNNIWYEYKESSDTVFVFVHGILSDSGSAWRYIDEKSASKNAYWPELVVEDPSFENVSVFLGGYYTEVASGSYSIRDAANQLYQSLSLQIAPADKSVLAFRRIVFVTHSMGGIAVRHLLFRNKEKFKDKEVGLMLIASPSGGSRYANYLSGVVDALENKMGRQLRLDNDFLSELDNDFKNLVDHEDIPSLVGKELVENHFIEKWLGLFTRLRPIVVEESAGRYFDEPVKIPDSDHFSIVKPNNPSHPSHLSLRAFYQNKLLEKIRTDCESRRRTLMRLEMASHHSVPSEQRFETLRPPLPILRLNSEEPLWDGPHTLARYDPPTNHYERHVDVPCAGEAYRGKVVRAVLDASRMAQHQDPITEVCFRATGIPAREALISLSCAEGQNCQIRSSSDNFAKSCDTSARGWNWGLFGTAYAGTATSWPEELAWVAPAIETLQKYPSEERPGYTHFVIATEKASGSYGLTHFTYEILVNGVSVLVDGWPAHYIRTPLSDDKPLQFDFALQNLDFSGAKGGYETISVGLRLMSGGEVAHSLDLERDYAALRPADTVFFEDKWLGNMTWRGQYVAPTHQDKFQIFLASSTNLSALEISRSFINEQKLMVETTAGSKELIGVVRPPLPTNENFGLSAAIRLASGQTRFTFNHDDSVKACRSLLLLRETEAGKGLIRKDIYRRMLGTVPEGETRYVQCKYLVERTLAKAS